MMSTVTIIPIPQPPIAGARGSTAVPQIANISRKVSTASKAITSPASNPAFGAGVPIP